MGMFINFVRLMRQRSKLGGDFLFESGEFLALIIGYCGAI